MTSPTKESNSNGPTQYAPAAVTSNDAQDENASELERIDEQKLKSKYPAGLLGPGGPSAFLQKRLKKGIKFFDSGDYQMAKQKGLDNEAATGEVIPTPETVSACKISILQPCNHFTAGKTNSQNHGLKKNH